MRSVQTTVPAFLVLCLFWAGCGSHSPGQCQNGNCNNRPEFVLSFAAMDETHRPVDVLFVVDNSQNMGREQYNLVQAFPELAGALRDIKEGLPSLHVGVITTDLGSGIHETWWCEVGGDRAVLGTTGHSGRDTGSICIGPDQRYIVDVEPADCPVEKDPTGGCTGHGCTQSNCDRVQYGVESLALVTDGRGCPRCRNHAGTLEEAFFCIVWDPGGIGTGGCGFEQPLEAMYKALDPGATPENDGFVRDGALLVVVILSDEDDCSASQPDMIFDTDPDLNNIDSELGYYSSFRCFEFGVTCDVNGRELGPRTDCRPRDEPDALLHPITRYTAFLEAFKDPAMLVVGTIAGPFDGSVVVERAAGPTGEPSLAYSCTDSVSSGAKPAVRLKAFTSRFNDLDAMSGWAYTSACADDFGPVLQGIANRVVALLPPLSRCFPQPVAGCPYGPAGTACSPCFPQCTFVEEQDRGGPDHARFEIPWCGAVCLAGPCTEAAMQPCAYDENGRCTCSPPFYPTRVSETEGCAELYYPEGVPEVDRDPLLAGVIPRQQPTCTGAECPEGTEGRAPACWYLGADDACPYQSIVRIVRAEDPVPQTVVTGRCVEGFQVENNCSDGVDEDEDCLVDSVDPDCQ